jgi:hypothetical protein
LKDILSSIGLLKSTTQTISAAEFIQNLESGRDSEADTSLPFLPSLAVDAGAGYPSMEVITDNTKKVSHTITNCPPINQHLMKSYVDVWRRIGFLPA